MDVPEGIARRRFAIVQATLIARSRPSLFFYPLLVAAYLPLVARDTRDLVASLVTLAILFSLALARRAFYRSPTDGVDPDAWRARYRWFAVANIFVFDSLVGFELWHRALDPVSTILMVGSAAIRASSAYAASMDLRTHQVFARWTRWPVIVGAIAVGTSAGVMLACLIVMHVLYVEVHAKQLNAEYWTNIQSNEQRERVEIELRLAHKLESVGRLAAGIAHEINTPLQAMMGNLEFLKEGVDELLAMAAPTPAQTEDLAYLRENLPSAVSITHEAVERTAAIVRSVRTFAHPDLAKKAPLDINRALQTTLDISRHEYAMVADVQTEFGELPLVECYAGELNQALLNIVVNAAHAIGARKAETGQRGLIRITTATRGAFVRIEIGDDGNGIPDAIRDRIFDPFFTTKEVGKGTGQGLALARNVVAHHHGALTFDTTVGRGTTFVIELPGLPTEQMAYSAAS